MDTQAELSAQSSSPMPFQSAVLQVSALLGILVFFFTSIELIEKSFKLMGQGC